MEIYDLIVNHTRAWCKGLIERLMREERDHYLSKSPQTKANGFYLRKISTQIGSFEDVRIPRTRDSGFRSCLVPFGRCNVDLQNLVRDLHDEGMGLRRIERILKKHFDTNLSPALLSKLACATKEEIEVWRSRPLEQYYSVIHLDCFFFPLKRDKTTSEAVYVVLAESRWGRREILGYWLPGGSESSFNWHRILTELRDRGVKQVDYVVADGLTGIKNAILQAFPDARYQHCALHAMRNCLHMVRARDKEAIGKELKQLYRAENIEHARLKLEWIEQRWSPIYPKVIKFLKTHFKDTTAFMEQPLPIRRFIYTNNCIESLHKQVKRRIGVMEQFVNEFSAVQILYRLFTKRNDGWSRNALNEWRNFYQPMNLGKVLDEEAQVLRQGGT